MTEYTVASSYIDYTKDGDVAAHQGQRFDLSAYSRMKYGSQTHARNYGYQLAIDLLTEVPEIVLSSAPLRALITYKSVPSAAATITRAAVARLTQARYDAGLDTVELVHVETGKVLGRDYSSLDEEGRARYIAETGYNLREKDIWGANVLIIDDIRNTGAAEGLVRRLLAGKNYLNTIFAYLAIMNEESAKRDPEVERRINTATTKDLDGLLDIIENDGMTLTIRTMKMVLGESDHKKLSQFLHKLPEHLLCEIYAGTLGSGHEFVSHYRHGFAMLQHVARQRGCL